jgi:hypothetical protein
LERKESLAKVGFLDAPFKVSPMPFMVMVQL